MTAADAATNPKRMAAADVKSDRRSGAAWTGSTRMFLLQTAGINLNAHIARTVSTIAGASCNANGRVAVAVSGIRQTGKDKKSLRIQLTGKANQIAEIDAYARQHGFNRSGLMILASLEYIHSRA